MFSFSTGTLLCLYCCIPFLSLPLLVVLHFFPFKTSTPFPSRSPSLVPTFHYFVVLWLVVQMCVCVCILILCSLHLELRVSQPASTQCTQCNKVFVHFLTGTCKFWGTTTVTHNTVLLSSPPDICNQKHVALNQWK